MIQSSDAYRIPPPSKGSAMFPKQIPAGSLLLDHVEGVNVARDWRTFPTFPQLRDAARRTFAADSLYPVRSVQGVCIRANGEIELVGFGPRGGHQTLWSFGDPCAEFAGCGQLPIVSGAAMNR